jgi:hypothetical protein
MTMEMSNSVWGLLCLFTAVSAFHPHTTHLRARPCRDPANVRHRRGRVFHLELSTSIPSGGLFVNAEETLTKVKDGSNSNANHYRDLLGIFSADLERLSDLRPPTASADISDTKTIISAGSSYTLHAAMDTLVVEAARNVRQVESSLSSSSLSGTTVSDTYVYARILLIPSFV